MSDLAPNNTLSELLSKDKKDIRAFTLPELQTLFVASGLPAFRARQVYAWLWQKAYTSFDEMNDLPKNLRTLLSDTFEIRAIKPAREQRSADGTIKVGFELYDAHWIEGVLITAPEQQRMTACVSSQVGCSLACKFCATGFLKMRRNLQADEIFDQVVHIDRLAKQHHGQALTNIVYMGMGEPLLNYKNVLKSIERISAPDGLNMSPRRITVSTAGIAKMIAKLADDDTRFNLALSLHAANDEKRNEIMPINESNNLQALAEALRYYYQKLKRPVTYEYIVFKQINDSLSDAAQLLRFCRNIPCKVNLIEYNLVEGVPYEKTSEDRLEAFHQYLERNGITATVRRSRGKDIDAACGQLANKIEK